MLVNLKKIRNFMFGAPRDLLDKNIRKHVSLVAFYAWVGLGADGLSSSCYGPQEAFLALGQHTQLAVFLAIATALTVGIISVAYTQVIELFPGGGGGYRVATELLGPKAGLVSGSALVVDYVLTIAISVASGVDAMFSLIPPNFQPFKIWVDFVLVGVLVVLNLRGMKESIRLLMPIFLGFVITHIFLIIYGISSHSSGLSLLIPDAIAETQNFSIVSGGAVVAALALKAFSLGGGTYTGLEAVSNNVHTLAEPKVKTAKYTMLFMALSLAFVAGGITLLYLLWGVQHVEGQTLNASVFSKIMSGWQIGDVSLGGYVLPVVLALEAGLLFVAANTGFLGGPAVLANMATDKWMPHFFSALSSRLVVKNGIVIMGILAVGSLIITGGDVRVLVVLYSINVFLTFTLSLLGLSVHWIRSRKGKWVRNLLVSATGLLVCAVILVVTVVEKFSSGGWLTIFITSLIIWLGWSIHRHYLHVEKSIENSLLLTDEDDNCPKCENAPKVDYSKSTAVLVVGDASSGMHTLLWVLRMFPKVFHNFVFISIGEVDSGTFNEETAWRRMRRDSKKMLKRFENYCHRHNMPASSYLAYGTDVVEQLTELADKVIADFPNTIFFGTKLVFENDDILNQLLHNQTAYILQRRLHVKGRNFIILPMVVS